MTHAKDRIYTTGLLNNFEFIDFADHVHVEAANFDAEDPRIVSVEAYDWTDNVPVALSVVSFNGPDFTFGGGTRIVIEPNTSAFFIVEDVSDSLSYEVRITLHNTSEDVVVNVFGHGPVLNRVLDVLHADLRRIDQD